VVTENEQDIFRSVKVKPLSPRRRYEVDLGNLLVGVSPNTSKPHELELGSIYDGASFFGWLFTRFADAAAKVGELMRGSARELRSSPTSLLARIGLAS